MPTVIDGNINSLSDVDLVRVLFRIDKVNNDTFQATVVENNEVYRNSTITDDDHLGELYYVVVVLSVYAFAIVMFIASFVKKSGQDHGISIYMRDLEKVKRLEKRQEKFRFKLQMVHKDRKHRILGDNRAIVEGRRSSEGDIMEQNLLIKPDADSTSIWSLVSLNMEDNASILSASSANAVDRGLMNSAPPSPVLQPSNPGILAAVQPSTPVSPVNTSFSNCIGTIPEVKIETCE